MAPKKKQEKMSLGTFLGDQSLGSWADEMEDMPVNSSGSRTGYGGDSSRGFGGSRPGFGDTSGYSERNYQPRAELPLPTKPPYTAHLGNLSFDVTSADIEDLFAGCAVTNVRIVEDKQDHKPKGFGYVEFGTLDGLKKALDSNGTQFQGRSIRVSIAEPQRQEAREISDWTRKGPLPELPTNQRRPSDRGAGGYRNNFDNASDAGSDRGSGPRRNFSFEPSDGKPRDFGNWERKGPLSPPQPPPNQMRDAGRIRSNERSFERKPSPAWGEGRSQDGSRPPRREFQDRPAPERVPTAAEMDNQWRTKMRPDVAKSPTATPDVSMPSSPVAAAPAVPATRPKLNLQKRTVSDTGSSDPAPQAATSDSKASPFGAARPIDTAAKEKEIEEKRLALRLKKEEEDKEREKKKEEEKERKRVAAEKAKAEQVTSPVSENGRTLTREISKEPAKENGATPPAPTKSYEILRRMTDADDEDAEDAEDDPLDAPANGAIADHDPVMPGEVTRDIASPPEDSTAQSTATALEEDGWQTISKPPRKGKPANGSARAIAS